MASTVAKAKDSTIAIGGAVAQVISCSANESVSFIDFTNLDSTAKEQVKDVLTQEGAISCEVYANATHAAMLGKIDEAETAEAVTLTLKDGTTALLTGTGNAWLNGYDISGVEVGGVIKAKFDLILDAPLAWA